MARRRCAARATLLCFLTSLRKQTDSCRNQKAKPTSEVSASRSASSAMPPAGSGTARTAKVAAAAAERERIERNGGRRERDDHHNQPHEPIVRQSSGSALMYAQLDLATLPPESVHKYLLFYNLLPPQPLKHEHAVRPLAATTHPEKVQRRRAADLATAESQAPMDIDGAPSRDVSPPAAEELSGPPPLGQEPDQADRRLVALATAHWTRAQSIKEGETITNFMYALRKVRCRASRPR